MIARHTSLIDVAFEVCGALDRAGIRAVLTGGSAASYYAPNQYTSDDADYVVAVSSGAQISDVMKTLGYRREGRMFAHESNPYTVEFPSGPLAVGQDLVKTWHTDRRNDRVLYVLTRTDSVRDRLCGYYFWDEPQSLRVAVHVARSGAVDYDVIRDWSFRENAAQKFEEFIKAMERTK